MYSLSIAAAVVVLPVPGESDARYNDLIRDWPLSSATSANWRVNVDVYWRTISYTR
ncbi:hypothetical protein [Paenibacillus agricola]|uniref:hypothetical protein n=1 Tax=Paenibacillus agricola TaxID=2716264 RepID=UPI002892B8F1|nr:hypothetical protein [Paenibacillus agricola]